MTKNKAKPLDLRGQLGRTPLMRAAKLGDLESVKALAELGALLDLQDNYGYTALMLAAQRGRSRVVDFLLAFGVEANLRTNFCEDTALDFAVLADRIECVKSLLTKGKLFYPRYFSDQKDILAEAASHGSLELVNILLEVFPAEIDKISSLRRAITAARRAHRGEILKLLREELKKQ